MKIERSFGIFEELQKGNGKLEWLATGSLWLAGWQINSERIEIGAVTWRNQDCSQREGRLHL
jgi:hypothetical protein